MKKLLTLIFVLLMLSSVVNAANFDDTSNLNCDFAVDRLYYLGIINGTSASTYSPDKNVTRAEFSKMIVNALGVTNNGNVNSFSDINGHWAKDFILKASSQGILNGYTDGTFKPDNEVTYAEATAIIMRSLGYKDLEKNVSGAWYENYISEMERIKLNYEMDKFEPTAAANRGDIAILLWNMIASNYRVNSGKTILEERFGKYTFWTDAKVTDISTYGKDIIYDTTKGKLVMKQDISFSDLGGIVSGFYDSSKQTLIGKKTEEGKNVEKISGSLKELRSYSPLSSSNVYGYGDKSYAEYVEIFVERGTKNIVRVVFYDTRESHFAENVKITDKNVSIESRDVYDEIIVLLDDNSTLKYKVLRTESVKDINKSALLVSDGKVVDWTSIPNNSVIREIKKDLIYTYTNKYIDGDLKGASVNLKTLTIDDKEYDVADDCICQNSKTHDTMTLKEGLTRNDIQKISKENGKVRIYLNEFNEVVKLEFEYDIWKINQQDKREKEYKELEKELNKIGFVTSTYYTSENDDEGKENVSVLSLPSSKRKSFITKENTFEVGDFVYSKSGDDLTKISNNIDFEFFKLEYNSDNIEEYTIDESSQIIEVLLQFSDKNKNEYSSASLRQIKYDDLSDFSRYKNIFLIINKDNVILRLYAVKELGIEHNFGIVKKINETISGDVLVETKVSIYNSSKNTKKYVSNPVMGFSEGDLVIYDLEDNKLSVVESYRHELIGNEKDLVIDKFSKGVISFKNSSDTIDINSNSFEIDKRRYEFEDLTLVNAVVSKKKDSDDWEFSSFNTVSKTKLNIRSGYRVALNEITGTLIVYSGYTGD